MLISCHQAQPLGSLPTHQPPTMGTPHPGVAVTTSSSHSVPLTACACPPPSHPPLTPPPPESLLHEVDRCTAPSPTVATASPL